jgi:hypothetical protein
MHDATGSARATKGTAMNNEPIRKAYEETAGRWACCDWPTRFGATGLDLNGRTTAEAARLATSCGDARASEDWGAAARWLAEVELYAERAEVQAALALAAANAGDLEEALDHARRAYALELELCRPVEPEIRPTWRRLCEAIEQTHETTVPARARPPSETGIWQEKDLLAQMDLLHRQVIRLTRRVHRLEKAQQHGIEERDRSRT